MQVRDLADRLWYAAAHRHLLQPQVGEEADPLAVGREKGSERSLGAGNRRTLQLGEVSQVQPTTLVRGAEVDQVATVR